MTDNGYKVWLRYEKQPKLDVSIQKAIFYLPEDETQRALVESSAAECRLALPLLTDGNFPVETCAPHAVLAEGYGIIAGVYNDLPADLTGELLSVLQSIRSGFTFASLKKGGFCIVPRMTKNAASVVVASSAEGVLYGTFSLLRTFQQGSSVACIIDEPKVQLRMLDHWDNLDGSIERGYAGKSLWNWKELPQTVSLRYTDYARMCASVGLNAAALNNVNTQSEILSTEYLEKTTAIAAVLRRYGMRTFLSVNFASPVLLGGLKTADPCDDSVIAWWKEKIAEVYALMPDFGGFLMKADSEGQPGPFAYNRTHADGANMFASLLEPYGGSIIWRAFVYGQGETDRAKKAYADFKPLDGQFMSNAALQVKNGAIDFQPREPVHPLFGAMNHTNMVMEFQIAQEYLGQGNHLVFLAPMWKEILDFDTHANGEGSTVGNLLSAPNGAKSGCGSGFAAVSNTGNNEDWCGSLFHPANLYAYGRLSWDYTLESEAIAAEWTRCTWGTDSAVFDAVMYILLHSWNACVDYMTPLCLHHIMKYHHHYGPDPACDEGAREDWKPRYYHRADSVGLGFDRTQSGSNAVSQYAPPVRDMFANLKTCPEKYLLWFHHVPWNYTLSSGRTLRDELVFRYNTGVEEASALRTHWLGVKDRVDSVRYEAVLKKLSIQYKDACEWRDVCLSYFMGFACKCAKKSEEKA